MAKNDREPIEDFDAISQSFPQGAQITRRNIEDLNGALREYTERGIPDEEVPDIEKMRGIRDIAQSIREIQQRLQATAALGVFMGFLEGYNKQDADIISPNENITQISRSNDRQEYQVNHPELKLVYGKAISIIQEAEEDGEINCVLTQSEPDDSGKYIVTLQRPPDIASDRAIDLLVTRGRQGNEIVHAITFRGVIPD